MVAGRGGDSGVSFEARFAELYRIAHQRALAIVRTPAVAEDCAQEALARAFTRWHLVAGHATPWVSRVATNLAIDHLRHGRRWVTTGQDSLAERERPSTDQDTVDGRQAIVAAFGCLSGRQRDAVALRYLTDLSEADTAAAMHCSVGSVKSSSSRGLRRLRSTLEHGERHAPAC